MPPQQALTQPLLSEEQEESSPPEEESPVVGDHDGDDESPPTAATPEDAAPPPFSLSNELMELITLGWPLAVSFFCRMGMASTDSAFVGHIDDAEHSAEVYLAAAVLSDMVVNVCITPPLAFNQVLNAMVGQAMGSGRPEMAGIWLQQSIFWLTVTMLPCLTGLWYVEGILVGLGFPPTVAKLAGVYAKYNVFWTVPNGIYQCMRFYFQAQGLPRPAMYNNLLFLFVNALLNWILVFGGPFSWNGFGFIGAAMSLSVSRTMQPLLYYLYMFVYRRHHQATFPTRENEESYYTYLRRHHSWARTKEFLKQGLPNIGTLLFQVLASQATTVLVGRLGERAIAASAALQTVTIPWSGTISASCTTMTGVRVGYHMGKGDGHAARQTTGLVLGMISMFMIVVTMVFLPLQSSILQIATDDPNVLDAARPLVVALLVGTYLTLIVSNITSGVFSGMGRPVIATILSFGFELPMSIGGVAIYVLYMKHPQLLGVYWWTAISGGLEVIVVVAILYASDWTYWAGKAQERQAVQGNAADSTGEDETPATVVVNAGDGAEGEGSNRDSLAEPLLPTTGTSAGTTTEETGATGQEETV